MSAIDVACTWIGRAWAVAALLLVGAVVCACWTDARRRRADVRAVRARGYALFREDSGPADWQAVQDAVNRVRRRNDEITDADFDLWRIENGWQSA